MTPPSTQFPLPQYVSMVISFLSEKCKCIYKYKQIHINIAFYTNSSIRYLLFLPCIFFFFFLSMKETLSAPVTENSMAWLTPPQDPGHQTIISEPFLSSLACTFLVDGFILRLVPSPLLWGPPLPVPAPGWYPNSLAIPRERTCLPRSQ